MKKLKIRPIGDQIFLNVEKANLGNLDASSVSTGMEWATIAAVGPDVQDKSLKPGVKVFCKGWAQDCILFEGENYIFTSESRKGICAIID